MAGNQGLGSDNMSQADKDRIHKAGGEASNTGGNTTSRSSSTSSRGTTTNKAGGGGLTDADRSKGGKTSRGGGR